MTNILVAIDGSDTSMRALGWALELAKTVPEPRFHLLHSCHVAVPVSEVGAMDYPKLMEQAEADGRAILQRAAAAVGSVPRELHLVHRLAGPAIVEMARQVDAGLVAVGSRGLGRMASVLMGSVSTEVAYQARVPVLVAHETEPQPIKRVLIGVDGSDHSARALMFAARWLPEAELAVMHVLNAVPEEVRTLFKDLDISVDHTLYEAARDVVHRVTREAGLPQNRVQPISSTGSAAEELLAEYRSGRYDLAVVGSRGRGRLPELLLGGVTERMVRMAPGPVVVVR